jgi:LuxR family transcriptional regulator, maltose regulon positive regulatory protein
LTRSKASYQDVITDVSSGHSPVVDDTSVLESVRETGRAGGPAFGLAASKLRCPPTRPGTVHRSSLIDRLARDDCGPIVSVVAPAGYGKTTLLSQWAERNGHAFAWVSIAETDNDPKVLLTYIAAALDAVQPTGGPVFDALASPVSSVPGSVMPRLGSAFATMTVPVVLVLDDVHLLHNRECRSALSVLADHVPAGSRLVLAGRAEPPLRVARLRAEGRITEIGPADLSLTPEEAASVLRGAKVVLGRDEVAVLHQRTEGWPAALYLAALYLREGGSVGSLAVPFRGDDRLVSEYVESEFLSRISRRQRAFLTRTAVLDRMCGPLCEAVLEQPGADTTLAELAASNLLLVPLDRRGWWYRYHHLFRDMLLGELHRLEPELIPVLQRRAAGWYLRNDLPEEALEYSMAAGDAETAALLVEKLAWPTYKQARLATVQRWLRWLSDRGAIGGRPMTLVWASMIASQTARPAEADRWADAVDRWQHGDAVWPGDPFTEAWTAVLRALLCRHGVKQMRADADEAARRCAAAGIAPPVTALLQGVARVLSGDLDGGDAFFEDAVSMRESGAPDVLAEAVSERALLAITRGEWSLAEALAGQAAAVLGQAGIDDLLTSAVRARVACHRGDIPAARQELIAAQRLRPLVTYAQPQFAVQARIELTRVCVALNDMEGARMLMREIDEVLRRRPDLGTLADETQALRTRLATERRSSGQGASSLTSAEMRLLPMLATHLSGPEIAAELFLSPHTVKSHQLSLYRKLGTSSRSQAVARARELGLLEG